MSAGAAATPLSPTQLAATTLAALACSNRDTILTPVSGSEPVLSQEQAAALLAVSASGAGEVVGVVSFMTPFLEQLCLPATAGADPCRPLLVNSERLPWLAPAATPARADLQQKPDLFLSWAPFVELREATSGQIGGSHSFGKLAGCALQHSRCAVALFEAKRGSLTEAHFGELCGYHQAIPGLCRGMLFGAAEFWLYETVSGVPASLVRGTWRTEGSAAAIRDFFAEAALKPPPLVLLLRRLLTDLRVSARHQGGARCFLGAGATGYVFAVAAPPAQDSAGTPAAAAGSEQLQALKVVLARADGDSLNSVAQEFLRLSEAAAAGAPVVRPVRDSLRFYAATSDQGFAGAGYLMERVGEPFHACASLANCSAAFTALAALHTRRICHGDPLLPNLLLVDSQPAWVDFHVAGTLATGDMGPSVAAIDAAKLVRSMLGPGRGTSLPDAVNRALDAYRPADASTVSALARAVWRSRGDAAPASLPGAPRMRRRSNYHDVHGC